MRDTPHSHAHTSQQKAEPAKQQQLATCAAKQPFPKAAKATQISQNGHSTGLPSTSKQSPAVESRSLFCFTHGCKLGQFFFFFFYAAKGEAKPPSLYIKLPTETFGAWPEAEEARATFQLLATLLKCTEAARKLPNGAPSPTNKEEGQTPPRCTTERQPRSSLGGHFQELPRVPGRKFGLSLLRHPLSACTHSSRCPLEGQQ